MYHCRAPPSNTSEVYFTPQPPPLLGLVSPTPLTGTHLPILIIDAGANGKCILIHHASNQHDPTRGIQAHRSLSLDLDQSLLRGSTHPINHRHHAPPLYHPHLLKFGGIDASLLSLLASPVARPSMSTCPRRQPLLSAPCLVSRRLQLFPEPQNGLMGFPGSS